MQKLLLVEDDPEITKLINLHLDATQYDLTCCSSGKAALTAMNQSIFNLVMLDITLPDMSGIDICRRMRLTDSKTPIMMITCHAEETDKVLALEIGADDYITKPFGILELMARIKAVMRRNGLATGQSITTEIRHGELIIDNVKKKVTLGGKRLDLTVKEFDLLLLLAANPGKTFTRKELLEEVWGFSFSGYEHTVTSHINRVRLKLEHDLNHPEYILTAWGSGYRFAE